MVALVGAAIAREALPGSPQDLFIPQGPLLSLKETRPGRVTPIPDTAWGVAKG